MTGDDIERLRKLIEAENDPQIKSAARAALFALLRKPVREESEAIERREVARTERNLGLVLVIVAPIVALPLVLTGVVSVPAGAAAAILPGAIRFGMRLLGKGDEK